MRPIRPFLAVALVFAAIGAAPPASRDAPILEPLHFRELSWRSVGPANMGGRVSDFAVVEKRPATFYVATGTGGVFKTTNHGHDLERRVREAAGGLDRRGGGVAEEPRRGLGRHRRGQQPQLLVVGQRRLPLARRRRHLDAPRARRHPQHRAASCSTRRTATSSTSRRSAACGARTPSAACSSRATAARPGAHALKVDARTGACDLVMDPADPRTLYAAMYARRRTPWSYTSGGTQRRHLQDHRRRAHLDASSTGGLPAETGRIGLDVSRQGSARSCYAVVESDEGGQHRRVRGQEPHRRRVPQRGRRRALDAAQPVHAARVLLQPDPRPARRRPPRLPARLRPLGLGRRRAHVPRGWRQEPAPGLSTRCGSIPRNGEPRAAGTDGGIYLSHDRTANWDFLNNLAIGEFYNIAADMREPYWIYGGLQDNQTWGGPSQTRFDPEYVARRGAQHDGITNDDWFCLGGGDGFHVAVDPTDPDIVYYESQGAYLRRASNLRSGTERGPAAVEQGGRAALPLQLELAVPDLAARSDGAVARAATTCSGSTARGDRWELASPDLTTRDPDKMVTGGSARRDPLHHRHARRVPDHEGAGVGRHRRRQGVGHAGRRRATGPT